VVALDTRGYNLSDRPTGGYDLATLTADVRGVIEALGERQADVVGHDWGGLIAWAFAMREPDYLRRLVVVNAPHPATLTREWRHPGQFRRSAYVGFFQLRSIAEDSITRDNYSQIWRTFRSADRGRAWLTDDDIQRFVDAMARPGAVTAAPQLLSPASAPWRGGALPGARDYRANAAALGRAGPLPWPVDGRRPGTLGARLARAPFLDGGPLAQPADTRAGQRRATGLPASASRLIRSPPMTAT
jgi:pimeloyl-ACP methyl ester carboxylesterase